jgi:hypothetical protein
MNDVWSFYHLPTNIDPARQTRASGRRIARARHNKGKNAPGCHALYLDWHADWVRADDMTPDMWRFRK